MLNAKKEKRIAKFLFEVGTMRKLMRMHRQVLLTDDLSDSIASHSYRVSFIGWFLAKEEGIDPYKVVMMCLLHDLAEARSGDHNWVHKRYVRVFDEEINEEQLGNLPYKDFQKIANEYRERKTKEAILAKDSDLLDQILLLREYEWQGNKEASIWLHGKGKKKKNEQLKKLKSASARKLGAAIYKENPSDWWDTLWTSLNRKQ
jgi:putative hydrolase of HD superfamily